MTDVLQRPLTGSEEEENGLSHGISVNDYYLSEEDNLGPSAGL